VKKKNLELEKKEKEINSLKNEVVKVLIYYIYEHYSSLLYVKLHCMFCPAWLLI